MKNYLLKLDKSFLDKVKEISFEARKQKISLYLVGGIVRDILLGERILDIDIVVERNAISFTQHLAKHFNARCLTHPPFKTASLFFSDNFRIDFVTARSETYRFPGALPSVKPGFLEEDLFRRDFTINAMAISLNPGSWGELIDPFCGLKDLSKKIIRVLHEKSFIDDPTRILRAVRFEQRLGFSIEKKTGKLLKDAINKKCFFAVNIYRSFLEFKKMLQENPYLCLRRLNALKAMEFLVGTKRLGLGPIKGFDRREPMVFLLALFKEMTTDQRVFFLNKFSFTKKEKKALTESLKFKDVLKQLTKKDLTLSEVCVILKPFQRDVVSYFDLVARQKNIQKNIRMFLKEYSDK